MWLTLCGIKVGGQWADKKKCKALREIFVIASMRSGLTSFPFRLLVASMSDYNCFLKRPCTTFWTLVTRQYCHKLLRQISLLYMQLGAHDVAWNAACPCNLSKLLPLFFFFHTLTKGYSQRLMGQFLHKSWLSSNKKQRNLITVVPSGGKGWYCWANPIAWVMWWSVAVDNLKVICQYKSLVRWWADYSGHCFSCTQCTVGVTTRRQRLRKHSSGSIWAPIVPVPLI